MSRRREILVVPPNVDSMRLDRFLAEALPQRSRTAWQRELRQGGVLVSGKPAQARDLMRPGLEIVVNWNEEEVSPLDFRSEAIDQSLIVYRDEWLVVVNKPRGLVVHPSVGHRHDSLVHRLGPLLTPNEPQDVRPGVVHRLDRDTTGLLVLARTEMVRRVLSEAIQKRTVQRRYLAVVGGHLQVPHGTIEAPIARHPKQRLKMAVIAGGRSAVTHYRTLAQEKNHALVQLTLETGRTHQIRVHLASIGHPVVGDVLYGGESWSDLEGQALHAALLAFTHPVTRNPLCFTADPPDDWRALGGTRTDWDVLASPVFLNESPGCPSESTPDFLQKMGWPQARAYS